MVGNSIINSVVNQLTSQSNKQFTGRIDIQNAKGQTWHFYLGLGRLLWATGGIHPRRRWRRMMTQFCPEINSYVTVRDTDDYECWDYHLLTILIKRGKLTPEKVQCVTSGVLSEVLFDLIQGVSHKNAHPEGIEILKDSSVSNNGNGNSAETIGFKIHLTASVRPSNRGILPGNSIMNAEEAIRLSMEAWEKWSSMGLSNLSCDLAPKLLNLPELEKLTSTPVYQNLVNLVNGDRSLRDLSSIMKLELLNLTRSLVPYIQKKLIGFVEISDLPLMSVFRTAPHNPPDPNNPAYNKRSSDTISSETQDTSHPTVAPTGPMIVCIDDSKPIAQAIEKALTQTGYRVISVTDSIQALPTIMKCKPDLVLLDIMMPVINGYEICTQIRRVSTLKQVPIIFLTSNDGLVDRVRAQMVGASDFLSKPVTTERLLATVQKHIKVSKTT